MGNYFSRMGCCHADDDENGEFSNSATKPKEETTPIAASLKSLDLHIIDRQPETNNDNQEKACSFEKINELLASPTKIGAHANKNYSAKPLIAVYPKPLNAPPGFTDDSVIKELKERFKNRPVSKHMSIDDGDSENSDRQPILSRKSSCAPAKAYIPYTTESAPLDKFNFSIEKQTITYDSTPFVREETRPFIELKLSPVIELTPLIAEVIETKPEVTQNCVYLEQPKHLITANVDPPETIHESILVNTKEETILETLRNQVTNLQEDINIIPTKLDYINEGFKNSSSSLHKEEKTIVEKDSYGRYKVFKECIISTLVHNNEGFSDSSQTFADRWDITEEDNSQQQDPDVNEPKFQISTNSSYTTMNEDKLIQVRVLENPSPEDSYCSSSFSNYPNLGETEQLLPQDTPVCLWDDDNAHDADDEETFLDSTPPLLTNKIHTNNRAIKHSADHFVPDSDSSHDWPLPENTMMGRQCPSDWPVPENNMMGHQCPSDISDFVDKTVSICINAAQKSIVNDEITQEPSKEFSHKSFGKYILKKRVSFEDEASKNYDSNDSEPTTGPSKLPPEEEWILQKKTSFEDDINSLSPPELSSSLGQNGEELNWERKRNSNKTLLENYYHDHVVDDDYNDHVVEGDYHEHVVEGNYHGYVVDDDYHDHVIEGDYHDQVVEGDYHDHVLEGDYHNHVVEGDYDDHVVEGVYHDHVVEGDYHDHVIEGDYHDHVIEGDYHDHVAEGDYHNHVVESDYHDHVMEGDYPEYVVDEEYHGHGVEDEFPPPPKEFPSPPEEFLDFRELLEKEGFTKEQFVGISEQTANLQDYNQQVPYLKEDTSPLDISENTHLLADIGCSHFLEEAVSHSSGYDEQSIDNEHTSLLDNNEQQNLSYDSDSFHHCEQPSFDNDLLDQSNTSDYYSSGDRDLHSLEFNRQSKKVHKRKLSLETMQNKISTDEIIDTEMKISTSYPSTMESQTSYKVPRTGSFEFEDIAKDLSSFKSDFSLDADTDASSNLFSYSDIKIDPLNKVKHSFSQIQGNSRVNDQMMRTDEVSHEIRLPRRLSHELECINLSDPEEKKVILEPYFGYPIAKIIEVRKPKSGLGEEQPQKVTEDSQKVTPISIDTEKNSSSDEISERDIWDHSKDSGNALSHTQTNLHNNSLILFITSKPKETTVESVSDSTDKHSSKDREIVESKEILTNNENDETIEESELQPSPKLRRQSTLKTSEMFTMALMNELKQELSIDVKSPEIPTITMTSPNGSTTSSSRSSSPRGSLSDLSEYTGKELPAPQQIFSLRFRQPAADYVIFRNRLEKSFVSLENVLLRDNIILGTVKIKPTGNKKYVFLRCTFNTWETSVDIPATHTPSSFPNQYETFSFAITMPVSFEEVMRVLFAVCCKCDDQVYWDNNDNKNYEIVSTHTIQQEMLSNFRSSGTEAVLPKSHPSMLKKGVTSFTSNSPWNSASSIKETKHIRKSAICLNVSKPAADYVTFKSRLERDFVALEHVFNKDFMLTGSIKVKSLDVKKTVFIRCSFDSWKTFIDVPAGLSDKDFSYPYETYTFEMNVPTVFNTKMQFAVCFEAGDEVYWDNNADKNYQICFFDMYAKMKVDPWKGQ